MPARLPHRDDTLTIIVSYNSRALTLRAIASALAQQPAPRVVVVDNASSDGSADAIAARWPEVTLLRSAINLGFARAVNLAAAGADSRWILLLNPDAEMEAGALAALVTFAEAHPGAGIYGGRTLHADGRLNPDSCYGRITPWSATCIALGLTRVFRGSAFFDPEGLGGWQRDSAREVDIVVGCFCLIRRDLWDRLGGFDPLYWLYGEDADFCLRAQALTGKRPLFTPTATARHLGGATHDNNIRYRTLLAKGRITVMRQHWPARWRWMVQPLALTWAGTRAIAEAADRLWCRARRRKTEPGTWGAVWRSRADWLNGY